MIDTQAMYDSESEKITAVINNASLSSQEKEAELLKLRDEFEAKVKAAKSTLNTPGVIDIRDGLNALTDLEVYQRLVEDATYVAEQFYVDYAFDGPTYSG